MAGGLAGDEDADWDGVPVDGLVGLAGGYLDSLACLESDVVVLDLDGQFAVEDVEELAGVGVVVAGLCCVGGHCFFDDAEFRCADEVPAVAVGFAGAAPGVVFGVGGGDDPCGH